MSIPSRMCASTCLRPNKRTSHRCNASRARDACSHAPSRTSHAARRLALTALLPHAALDQLVAPERLVGAAEQRARFEQLAPPQQLLRLASPCSSSACSLTVPPCSHCAPQRRRRRAARGIGSVRSGPAARTTAVGARRYRWGCACVHACEAGGCTSVHACAGVSECVHAQAHARTRLSPLALRSLRCTTLPAWSVSSTKYLPANSRAQTNNHACHRALHVAMWRSCTASRSHAVHHTS